MRKCGRLRPRDDVHEVERVPAGERGVLEVREEPQTADDAGGEQIALRGLRSSRRPVVYVIAVDPAISAGNHHSAYA